MFGHPRLWIFPFLCMFVVVDLETLGHYRFCEDASTFATMHQLFVYQSCMYFSLVSSEEEEAMAMEVEDEVNWFEYCLVRRKLSRKQVTTEDLFDGHIRSFAAFVELPVGDLTSLNFPPGATSVVFIFGRTQRVFIRRPQGQLSPASSSLLRGLREFFTGRDNKTSQLDLFDGANHKTPVRSLAYDSDQKRLYVVLETGHLAGFDLVKRIWSRYLVRLPARKRKIDASRDGGNSGRDDTRHYSILYANRQLYLGVADAVYRLVEDDKRVMRALDKITLKHFFNCYNTSPLAIAIESSPSPAPNTRLSTTSSKFLGPQADPKNSNTLGGVVEESGFDSWMWMLIFSLSAVLCLLTSAIGFVSIKAYRGSVSLGAPEVTTKLEALSRSTKVTTTTSSDTTSSTATTATSDENRKSSSSTSPPISTEEELDTSRSSSRTSLFSFSFFSRRKKAEDQKSRRRGKRGQGGVQDKTPDYSSKLSFFNPNSINISESLSTLRAGPSRGSLTSMKSLKTLKITGINSSVADLRASPPRPVITLPTAELTFGRNRGPYKLGYLAKGAERPGGFQMKTRF